MVAKDVCEALGLARDSGGLGPRTLSIIAAYLLDPSAATIRSVQIEPATILDTARSLFGADHLAVHQIDKRHMAYLDDDAMSKTVTGLFTVAGREDAPVEGRALIVERSRRRSRSFPFPYD